MIMVKKHLKLDLVKEMVITPLTLPHFMSMRWRKSSRVSSRFYWVSVLDVLIDLFETPILGPSPLW